MTKHCGVVTDRSFHQGNAQLWAENPYRASQNELRMYYNSFNPKNDRPRIYSDEVEMADKEFISTRRTPLLPSFLRDSYDEIQNEKRVERWREKIGYFKNRLPPIDRNSLPCWRSSN